MNAYTTQSGKTIIAASRVVRPPGPDSRYRRTPASGTHAKR